MNKNKSSDNSEINLRQFTEDYNTKELPDFTLQADPVTASCPQCNFEGKTVFVKEVSPIQHIVCVALCIYCSWCGYCLIPYYAKYIGFATHKCQKCGAILGRNMLDKKRQ